MVGGQCVGPGEEGLMGGRRVRGSCCGLFGRGKGAWKGGERYSRQEKFVEEGGKQKGDGKNDTRGLGLA